MSGLKQRIYLLKAQSGSAMVECCIAMLPIIMLGSLILEVTYWHTAKHRLALAMSQAVDLATMHHGFESVAWQYLKHKRPELNIQVHDVRAVQAETEISAIFSEFADPALSKQFGQPTIRHDFLIAQHEKFKLLGWSGGRGPVSGKTILDANTLNFVVVGWHRPYLSWLSAVLTLWQGHGRIAIRVTQSAMMQSHRLKPKGNNDLTTSRFEINPHPQQSTQPYIPKAWKGAVPVQQACGAGECCSDEPASAE